LGRLIVSCFGNLAGWQAIAFTEPSQELQMTTLGNTESATVRRVQKRVGEFFGRGLNVCDVFHSSMGRFVANSPRRDGHHPLQQVLVELTHSLLEHDGVHERFMKNQTVGFTESGVANIPLFERVHRRGVEIFESHVLGIEIHSYPLGNRNTAFDVYALNSAETVHEAAQKILEGSSRAWFRRLSKITFLIEPGFSQLIQGDDPGYGYSPDQIAREALMYTPADGYIPVNVEELAESFRSEANPGVQFCNIFEFPVYFRLTHKLSVVTPVRDTTERRADFLGIEDNQILLRSTNVGAEFYIKSVAADFPFAEAPKNVNYGQEHDVMECAGESLYVGLWQYVNHQKNRFT
jgi:hypothetical protein